MFFRKQRELEVADNGEEKAQLAGGSHRHSRLLRVKTSTLK